MNTHQKAHVLVRRLTEARFNGPPDREPSSFGPPKSFGGYDDDAAPSRERPGSDPFGDDEAGGMEPEYGPELGSEKEDGLQVVSDYLSKANLSGSKSAVEWFDELESRQDDPDAAAARAALSVFMALGFVDEQINSKSVGAEEEGFEDEGSEEEGSDAPPPSTEDDEDDPSPKSKPSGDEDEGDDNEEDDRRGRD